MQTAAHILSEESSTLVIHASDRSTDFLKVIYSGKGYDVIDKRMEARDMYQEIAAHQRIYALGHGDSRGLYGPGFQLNEYFGKLLSQKPNGVYIWCNADAYAKANRLSGLVSGMFISEVGEAALFGIRATQAEVDASNQAFVRTVRACLDGGADPATVRSEYAKTNAVCKITKFNSDRLYVFNNGAATPALHKTSRGQECPSNEFDTQMVDASELEGDDFSLYHPK